MGTISVTTLSPCPVPSKRTPKGKHCSSASEQLLAAQNPLPKADRLHQLFADAPHSPQPPILCYHHWGLSALHQACLFYSPSHPPMLPPGALPLGIPPTLSLPCMLPGAGHKVHQQEPQRLDTLDTDTQILTHLHRVGWLIQGCLRCNSPIILSWLKIPPCHAPGSGRQPPPPTATWNGSSRTSSSEYVPPSDFWISH